MNNLEKRTARKCDQCGRYQSRNQLTAVPDDDGNATHLCDDCRPKAEKAALALDGFPVTAYFADGTVEDTTVAKAMDMDALVKSAEDRRGEWRRALETIDKALANAPYIAGGELAKAEAMDRLAKADPIAQFGRMVKALRREDQQNRIAERVASLVKSERSRRRVTGSTAETMAKAEKLKRKTAKLRKQSAESRARVAEAERLLGESVQKQLEYQAQVEAFTDDARTRIDAMMKRLTVHRQAPVIAERAAHDQRRAAWAEKARLATDPVLKQGYQELADEY